MEEMNDIPQTIRDQIGSGKIIATIDSINERADIARLDIIPQLVYDVLSRGVPAKDFISHCSGVLNFNQKKLKAVVREIKEKILKQFDYALLNYGVDIKEIDVSDAMTLDEYTKQHNEMLASVGIEVEKPVSTISLENFSDTEPENLGPVKISVSGPTDETTKKIEVTEEPAPLVIHREKPQTAAQENLPTKGYSQQTRGFSLPFGFFKQKIVQTQAPSTPVKATIEFWKKDEPKKRAVDYSELRTPLTPFAGLTNNKQPTTDNTKITDIGIKETDRAQTQPITQKINPLMMFGNKQTTNNPQPTTQKEGGGILDIRTGERNDKQPKIENLRENTKTSAQGGPASGRQTAPVINTVPKQNTPTEQKPTPNPQQQKTEGQKGKGFVWFKKPTQKSTTITNNNTDKDPRIEGNTVDLRSTNNEK